MEGREFQTVRAAIGNAREPKWRLVRGTYRLAEPDDHKVREGMLGWRRSDRYDGVPVCKTL